jgi:hypothetical protein
VKLRCYLESLLRIHRQDCEYCHPHETWGPEIRKRLEELNARTKLQSVSNSDHEEVARVFDSKPNEGVANPQVSLAQQKKVV